jgi:ketosteroid isomerase-like protein
MPNDSLAMRVTKTAKTLVEVGKGGARAFSRSVGHQLEIIPASDVANARVGSAVRLRIQFAGRPVAQASVIAGGTPFTNSWDAPAAASGARPSEDRNREKTFTTDAAGMVTIPLDADGLWNVRVANAAPATAGSGAEWDVYFATLVFAVGTPPRHDVPPSTQGSAGDSTAVAAVVKGFHDALARGDSLTALSLLDPAVTILESGDEERLADYRAHHLAADIEFARAVRSVSTLIRVTVRGDVAWATSTSTATGSFRGRTINSAGAELMVVHRVAGHWRIAAIHWSSHAKRAP